MGSAPLTAIAGAEPKGNAAQSSTHGSAAGPGRSARCPCILSASHSRSASASRGGPLPASTILLIEADPASGELISGVLTEGRLHGHDHRRPRRGLRAVSPSISSRSSTSSPASKTAFDICREIRATPALARIPVLCVGQSDDVEDRIRFLEAGADDVMAKPFDARELEARVEALLLRFQRSKDMTVVSSDGLTVSASTSGPSPSTARGAASGRRRSRRTSRW